MQRVRVPVLFLIMILAGCALWEEPPGAPLPPLTLEPEPTMIFRGNCSDNRALADWLQYSTYYVEQFAQLVTTTAAGDRSAIRAGVIEIAALREEYAQVETPNCAEPGQRMFMNVMSRAIDTFQRYANGETNSLANLLPEILGEVDRINLVQEELRARLNAQLEQPADE
jgi:hypothetical protein